LRGGASGSIVGGTESGYQVRAGFVGARDGGIRNRRAGTTESGPDGDAPVTEHEGAASVEELRAELALLRTIVDLTSARIAYIARDGRILCATPAFARASGVEPASWSDGP